MRLNDKEIESLSQNFRKLLRERMLLTTVEQIANGETFSEQERVLIGNRYAVAYRFLEISEHSDKEILWLCQEHPTLAAEHYPLRMAQIEFGAYVLPAYTPEEIYFQSLENPHCFPLFIVQLKNRDDITENPSERGRFFLETLKAVSQSQYKIVFIHLDEGITQAELERSNEIIRALREIKESGKEVYFGTDKYLTGSPQSEFIRALMKGVI